MSKSDEFLEDLKYICEKHRVWITEFDNYDGEEHYTGSDWYFQGKDIFIHIDEDLI